MLTTNIHLTATGKSEARIVTPAGEVFISRAPYLVLKVSDGQGNEVNIFPTHDQARELAHVILAALYPVTAALAECEGVVQ